MIFIYIFFYLFYILITYYQVNTIVKKKFNNKPLYDIISNTIDLSNYSIYIDIFTFFFLIIFFINCNYKLLIIFFKIFSIIIFLRSISSSLTILPKSDLKCKINKFYLMIGHCNDKIFSGHCAITLLLILILFDNNIISLKYSLILFLIQFIYSISLILIKYHYSVDVFISYLVTIYTYYIFKNKI